MLRNPGARCGRREVGGRPGEADCLCGTPSRCPRALVERALSGKAHSRRHPPISTYRATQETIAQMRALDPEIDAAVRARDLLSVRNKLDDMSPADVATLLTESSVDDRALLFRCLPRRLATATFEY